MILKYRFELSIRIELTAELVVAHGAQVKFHVDFLLNERAGPERVATMLSIVYTCHYAVLELNVPLAQLQAIPYHLFILIALTIIESVLCVFTASEFAAQLSEPELLIGSCIVTCPILTGLAWGYSNQLDTVPHNGFTDPDTFVCF